MTQGGVLFELQMPGHLMGGQEFSSLPTPRAQARDVIYNRADYHFNLEEALALLPTPTVNDMEAGKDPQAWDEWAARQTAADGRPAPHGKSLEQEAIRLLPTPKATSNENQQNLEKYGPNLGMVLMQDHYNWPMLPTPTARDHKDFQIEAAKHRPEATDTLNRALAHHFGVNTNRPLPDGSPSPDQRHNQLFTEPTVSDSIPDSLSG
jgi:hypothetical protein